jgi:general secretion pathway protein A
MYERYFGFSSKPFEVSPNPKFLFLNPSYQEILASLIYGVKERKGLIAVVGEVGTGKTLMLYSMKERLGPHAKVVHIVNSNLTFRQMLQMALCDLGLATVERKLSKGQAIQILKNFSEQQMIEGHDVVLAVDEAQNLRSETMENLRMLSNLETSAGKLIQIVFAGQPELDGKLNKTSWRQVVQRISLKRYSVSLTEEETYRYVQHRLAIAGYGGNGLFDVPAQKLIWMYSKGIPRKINILCDNALLIVFGLGKQIITSEIMREVVNDLCWAAGDKIVHAKQKRVREDAYVLPKTPDLKSQYLQRVKLPALRIVLARQPSVIVFSRFFMLVGLSFAVWALVMR